MNKLLEEIMQQPAVLAGVRKYYSSPGAIPERTLQKLTRRRKPVVIFTGMGSSLFAAYPAQAFLSASGIRALTWETAELLHHHLKFLGPDTLLVAVSQSGETIEITRLLDTIPRRQPVVAVVNAEASTLARRGGMLLPMMAGRQCLVSTKTYMCSAVVLMYLAFAIAREDPRPLSHGVMQLIEAQEDILQHQDKVVPPAVEFFNHPTYTALMSRGPDLGTVRQGALMLKEVVRIGAEAMSAGQFRHGPIEIINTAHRYVVIARKNEMRARERSGITARFLLRLAEDIQVHGGRVLVFTDLPVEEAVNMRIVRVETARLGLGTLVDSLHLQLLAYSLALRMGLEPGKLWIAEEVSRVE